MPRIVSRCSTPFQAHAYSRTRLFSAVSIHAQAISAGTECTMLLMLENWALPVPSFELAMIVDESPVVGYDASRAGEPWRPNSHLTSASRSADLEGYAWLFVIFLSDEVSTWGSKKLRFGSDGRIMRPEITESGVETGRLLKITYEVVARHIFENTSGENTTSPYSVVVSAQMESIEQVEAHNKSKKFKDELFGTRIEPGEVSVTGLAPHPPFAHDEMGCVCVIEDENGSQESLVVLDDWFEQYRFHFTEFQRRPYVRIVLAQLGFVKGDEMPTSYDARMSHLETIANAMSALYEIDGSKRFKNLSTLEDMDYNRTNPKLADMDLNYGEANGPVMR